MGNNPGHFPGHFPGHSVRLTATHDASRPQKPREIEHQDTWGGCQRRQRIHPSGFDADIVGVDGIQISGWGGNAGGNITNHAVPIGAEELLTIWSKLDDAGRCDLLAVARGLAGAMR